MIAIKSAGARSFIRIAFPFVIIPLFTLIGTVVFDSGKHLVISLGVTAMTLLVFVSGYEKKKTGTRRMVIASVMIALCVLGRFIPIFKPITALTIITGMYLGGETGFLVGALSAVISNIFAGQGPWTAFQMLAWGLIGLIAGTASVPLKRHRWLLLTYGAVTGIAYSFIMDIWTTLWYSGGFDASVYLSALVTAIPYTVSYAVSNFIFLLFLAKPFGEKLERLHIKYGI
ncbi:MAG: ECF transporter S component [Ruminiclostridium sp.]|nr:ECF transporter S component [Ruminiclostridium sp.]